MIPYFSYRRRMFRTRAHTDRQRATGDTGEDLEGDSRVLEERGRGTIDEGRHGGVRRRECDGVDQNRWVDARIRGTLEDRGQHATRSEREEEAGCDASVGCRRLFM